MNSSNITKTASIQKVKSSVKPALLALFCLTMLLAVGKTISFIASLNRPYTANFSLPKNYEWSGLSSYNLVYATTQDDKKLSSLAFINFEPREQKVTVLHVADSIYASVPRGYGEWPIGSVYPLGQEDGRKGSVLLQLAMARLVGLPVDGVVIKTGLPQKVEEVIGSLRNNQFSLLTYGASIRSNIPTWELIQLGRYAASIRADKISSLDLAQSSITQSRLLPDSTRVLGVDSIQLDTFIRDNLSDTSITDENATISILNATSHPGLAQQAARLITNLGGTVIFTGNTESLEGKTMVIDHGESPSPITKNRLEEIFAPWCIKDPCYSQDPRVISTRSQFVIVLGEDFFTYWYKR